tara:strand:+ start:359 stop:490 length:132 start_codon:yes stop_codon:yes gene_type:complete
MVPVHLQGHDKSMVTCVDTQTDFYVDKSLATYVDIGQVIYVDM